MRWFYEAPETATTAAKLSSHSKSRDSFICLTDNELELYGYDRYAAVLMREGSKKKSLRLFTTATPLRLINPAESTSPVVIPKSYDLVLLDILATLCKDAVLLFVVLNVSSKQVRMVTEAEIKQYRCCFNAVTTKSEVDEWNSLRRIYYIRERLVFVIPKAIYQR